MQSPRKRSINWKLKLFAYVLAITSFSLSFLFFVYKGKVDYGNENSGSFRTIIDKKPNVLEKHFTQGLKGGKSFVHSEDFSKEIKLTRSDQNQWTCKSLNNCFNFERCNHGFKVYVYPAIKDNDVFMSSMYEDILDTVRKSEYATSDPEEACIFVPSLDTLDRDKLSKSFNKNADKIIADKMLYWKNGENHLIFNLFSGTWPSYEDDLSFKIGKAILAKSSFNLNTIRQNYDISIPLLPKNFPKLPKAYSENEHVNLFPIFRKYLLSFKGKRYLYGIGSETRNSLHLVHNNEDIVLLTTCRHEKNWEKFADSRCDEDNLNYDRFFILYLNSFFFLKKNASKF